MGKVTTARALYALADEQIGRFLKEHGFERAGDGDYQRRTPEGTDRIVIDGERKKYSVLVSHYPVDLEFIDDFLRGEDRGFPVGPYLSSRGVGQRRYERPFPSVGASAFQDVLRDLEHVALPWLRDLRDPRFFAKKVDTNALLYVAAAHERVGDVARARSAFEELFARFQMMLSEFGDPLVMKESGEQFIYLAEKLGREKERVTNFRRHLGYTRAFTPLADSPS